MSLERPPIPTEERKPAWRARLVPVTWKHMRDGRSRAICVTATLERGERRGCERRGLRDQASLRVVLALCRRLIVRCRALVLADASSKEQVYKRTEACLRPEEPHRDKKNSNKAGDACPK
jgi:hypothetical protein